MLRGTVCLSLVVVAALPAAASGPRRAPASPRCFGAASRDPLRACRNPALDRMVVPSPRRALRLPNAPCRVIDPRSVPVVCAFGARRDRRAPRSIALLGDSYATQWRAALGPVAEARGWQGFSLTRTGCPYSFATPVLPERLLGECLRWRRAVPRWLRRHPRISTVVVSAHRVRVAGGGGEAEVRGYLAAWAALPATVRRIVVIRRTPMNSTATRRCVLAAMARGAPAGPACALPRRFALQPDPEAAAARRASGSRVRLVDLTRFICGARSCFPVVGGALVYKNLGHITATFGATVAPYLGRALRRVLR